MSIWRSPGGYFLVAPSVNGNGPYVWQADLDTVRLADAPEWPAQWAIGDGTASGKPEPSKWTYRSESDRDLVVRRAIAYLGRMSAGVSGEDGHGASYAAAVAPVHGFALDRRTAFDLPAKEFHPRCKPEWTDKELWHKIDDAENKSHDKPRGWLRDAGQQGGQSATVDNASTHSNTSTGTQPPMPTPLSVRGIVRLYPHMRPPRIEGLLRDGETMNIIAASKIGKSWLAKAMAIHVATGRNWLGHECHAGRVLYVDNELHAETFSSRIRKTGG